MDDRREDLTPQSKPSDNRRSHPIGAAPNHSNSSAWGLGYVAAMQGEAERGLEMMTHDIGRIDSTESRFVLCAPCGMLSEVCAELGGWERAKAMADKALKLADSGADRLGTYAAYRALAITRQRDDWRGAKSAIEQAIRDAEQAGAKPNLAIG